MLNIQIAKQRHPEIYQKIFNTFNNNNFPCLYGKMSFMKNYMYAGIYKDTSQKSIILLANDLVEMSIFLKRVNLSKEEKKFSTFIAVFEQDKENLSFDKLWYYIIKNLHKIDKKRWVENATKKISDTDFKFSFNEELWYPVLITPNHPNKIRKSEIIILSFQPNKTFENNKEIDNDFYQNTRRKIHKKIDKIYSNQRPHYLSENSTGKSIVQFLGYDFEQNKDFKYPNLFT